MPQEKSKVVNETPIRTVPPARQDQLLRDKLIEDIAGQSARMDDLARQLIALELAVPGLYAAALKLVAGDKGTVSPGAWLYLAFACWALALALALIGLVPRKHPVDMSRLFADDGEGDGPLSIEGYFRHSALYKRRLLLLSCGLFFAGVCCAAGTWRHPILDRKGTNGIGKGVHDHENTPLLRVLAVRAHLRTGGRS